MWFWWSAGEAFIRASFKAEATNHGSSWWPSHCLHPSDQVDGDDEDGDGDDVGDDGNDDSEDGDDVDVGDDGYEHHINF